MAPSRILAPILALLGFRFGRGSAPGAGAASRRRGEPLPPLLVVEGHPDPSLSRVLRETAERLDATVCVIDRLEELKGDPDLDAVVGVVLTRLRNPSDLVAAREQARRIVGDRPVALLAPQPLSETLEARMPLDPSYVAPPVTAGRLLFALGLAADSAG